MFLGIVVTLRFTTRFQKTWLQWPVDLSLAVVIICYVYSMLRFPNEAWIWYSVATGVGVTLGVLVVTLLQIQSVRNLAGDGYGFQLIFTVVTRYIPGQMNRRACAAGIDVRCYEK